ncbi:recombinase family protein [Streptomyces sp. NPDC048304]|uniref:recombinase family protein n=1 Tax=Streptomyces sp. NPDC048304 TaxID=3154820 RepID=UPI0033F98EC0
MPEAFADKQSGKTDLGPELKVCHAFLDAGGILVVPSLGRYGRGLQDLINMVAELRQRAIGFSSLHDNLDTTTPGGRIVFHVFGALAEFIRELIVQGTTREGLAAARARGRVDGPPTTHRGSHPRRPRPAARPPPLDHLGRQAAGVSPDTFYHHVPDLKELRASSVSSQLEAPGSSSPRRDQPQRGGSFFDPTAHAGWRCLAVSWSVRPHVSSRSSPCTCFLREAPTLARWIPCPRQSPM